MASALRAARAAILAILLLSACGGSTASDGPDPGSGGTGARAGNGHSGAGGGSVGGSAGFGAGGSAGFGVGGSGGAAPIACGIDTDPITFQFTNNGSTPLYLHQSCQLEFELLRCSSESCQPLVVEAFCSAPCGQTVDDGCIVCEPCVDDALEIAPGASATYSWNGCTYSTEISPTGCNCHRAHLPLSGGYTLRAPVYASPEHVARGEPLWVAHTSFAMPWPDPTVELLLAPR